jgi:hypothetical protein
MPRLAVSWGWQKCNVGKISAWRIGGAFPSTAKNVIEGVR